MARWRESAMICWVFNKRRRSNYMETGTGTWIGVAVSSLGVLIALYEWRQRSKAERVMRDTLRRLAGDIQVVYSNAHWAESHCRNIAKSLTEPNADLKSITQEAVDGARDSTACARLLSVVHSKIRGIQKTLFNDPLQILPDIESEDVREASRRVSDAIAKGKS
jgi:hypothetical protein